MIRNGKVKKYMIINQHTSEYLSQKRNQRTILKLFKINKMKTAKLMGCSKSICKRKPTVINTYTNKRRKISKNNLTSYLTLHKNKNKAQSQDKEKMKIKLN